MIQRFKEFNVLNNNALRILLLAAIIPLLSTPACAEGLPPLTHKLTLMQEINPAPTLQLEDMDEELVNIKDLEGKVVIVNFWATWCPPCRREMGSLERLYQNTKDLNVDVLAVNIGEDIDTVFSFLGTIEPSPNFQMLFDTDATSLERWHVKGLPTTYILGPKGNIIYRAIGGRDFDHSEIEKKILDLLD